MPPLGLRLGLRAKLAIAFLVVLTPLLVLGLFDLYRDDAERRESVLQERLVTAQALAAIVDASFDRAVTVAQLLAANPTVRTMDSSSLDAFLSPYRSTYPEYESINVWDAEGRNLGASMPQPSAEARPNIADRDHFKQAMATGDTVVSSVVDARTTQRPSVGVVSAIKDPGGKPIGVVSVLIDLSALPRNLKDVHVSADQAILVADSSGMIAVDTIRPILSWDERNGSRYVPIRVAMSQGLYSGVETSIRGTPQVVTLARSARYGWIAGLTIPESSALGATRTRVFQQSAVAMLAILVAALLAWVFTRSITRPLDELTGAITAFGVGQMSRRARIHSGDEFGAAAATFNQMASALQDQRERLVFLGQLGADLASSLLLAPMAEALARRTTLVMGELCFACLLTDNGRDCRIFRFHSLASVPISTTQWLANGGCVPLVQRYILPACIDGQRVHVPDIGSEQMDADLQKLLLKEKVNSLIAVPLRARGKTVGIIAALSFSEEKRLGVEQLELAQGIAEIGSVAVENGLLFEELGRERSSLNELIERMAEGITVADGTGKILNLNRRAREILGIAEIGEVPLGLDEHLSQVDLRYPDGKPVPFEQRPIARAIRGEVFSAEEGIAVRPDGSATHLLFSSGVVRDESGVRLAMTIYMDITPIREMARAREEFISVVAHDLRGPITSIMGFASMLQGLPESMKGGSVEKKALQNILLGSKRLEHMVADLLDASRIEAHRLTISKERVDLVNATREVVERSIDQTGSHPVRVEARDEVAWVQADPVRLDQILGNLLSNAAKYSSPDSEIVVELSRLPGEVMVSVINQGEGIPPADREQVFTRFYRTRSARSSRATGLGLGLYITKGLVEAHGGRIWVDSEVGHYAAFRFTLPATT